jgi:hypothetical protein
LDVLTYNNRQRDGVEKKAAGRKWVGRTGCAVRGLQKIVSTELGKACVCVSVEKSAQQFQKLVVCGHSKKTQHIAKLC